MEAHLRMLTSLPVRTHLAKPAPDGRGSNGGYQAKTRERVVVLVRRLRREGKTYKQIKEELKVSSATITRIVRGYR